MYHNDEDLTQVRGRWPDFIIIGAMKSGTTTLWLLLANDPRIFMCEPKEPMFFSRDAVFRRGTDWYRGLFSGARDGQVCGEASTCYSRWPAYPEAARRIAALCPRVRLIYLMRHPVERAFSHYRHRMEERENRAESMLTFEEALAVEPEILDASRYMLQIEQYLAALPRRQLLCLTLDQLRDDPSGTVRQVQHFLGLSVKLMPMRRGQIRNEAGLRVARNGMRCLLKDVSSSAMYAPVRMLLPRSVRDRLRYWMCSPGVSRVLMASRIRAHQRRIAPLTAEMRARLVAEFEPWNRRLERFLGVSLANWYH
jgi:hypothetical protein